MNKNYFNKKDASKALIYVLVLQMIASLVCVFFLSSGIDTRSSTETFFYLIFQYVLTESVFLVAFIYLNKKNSINGFKVIGIKKKTDPITVVLCVLISVVVLLLSYHFFGYIDSFMEFIGFNRPDDPFVLDSWYKFILTVLVLAMWPALCEELIYRGAVFKGLSKMGAIASILLSSLMFSLMHLGVFQFFYQFFLGVIFAIIVLITGNIKLSMIMHFINNFLVLLLTFLNTKFGFTWFFWGNINFGITLCMFIVCCALIVGIIYIIKKRTKTELTNEKEISIPNKENRMANAIVIAIACVYVLISILNSLV